MISNECNKAVIALPSKRWKLCFESQQCHKNYFKNIFQKKFSSTKFGVCSKYRKIAKIVTHVNVLIYIMDVI